MRTWLLCVACAGCAATTPAQKIPFAQAQGSRAPAVERPKAPARARAPVDPKASPQLAKAMGTFLATAKQNRQGVKRGAPMPSAQVAAWTAVLDSADACLTQPLKQTSTLDLVRARLQLETELDADRHTYGDVPPQLAERVTRSLGRLSVRVVQLTRKVRRADPRTFWWPVEPVVVNSPYGHRVHPLHGGYRFHAGVDLEAQNTQPVQAASDGVVVWAGWNGAHGKQIELQHDPHLATRYSHLMSLFVEPGERVKKGTVIGLAGNTGAVTGAHLHFELRKDGMALDPEVLMPSTLPASLVSR